MQCWYQGHETGGTLADVLTGKVSPSGKLPYSMPRSAGQIPAHYSRKPSARRGYLADSTSALFTFGYGLSYSTFDVTAPALSRGTITKTDSVTVTVTVTNTGKVAAAEVVQLYVRDEYAGVTRPVLELKGFERVLLQPGERKLVELRLSPKQLAFYDINMNFVVEPREFTISVGTSSRRQDLKSVTLLVE